MTTTTVRPLQCQVEAARFATRRDRIDEVRATAIRVAVAHLVAGRRAAALDEMLDGLALQAPLTFRRPEGATT